MRAMQVVRLGEPLELRDVPAPEPGPGEVRLRVLACGLNFADTLMQSGSYQERADPPFTPGLEVCGIVERAGPGTAAPPPGTRVVSFGGSGGLADHAVMPAALCVPVPEAMPDAEAAGFAVAYGTSHMALAALARLRPGETLLVLGASGGVGLTAVEIGALMGARVIAVARGAEKQAIAAGAGAHHVLDSKHGLREAVKALGGADVVYDPVGGEAFDAALRACRPFARILPIGFASGQVPQIPANILLVKNLTVHGLYWGGVAKVAPVRVAESLDSLLAWYRQGRLHPHVSEVLPLVATNDGLSLLRERRATGKVVIRID